MPVALEATPLLFSSVPVPPSVTGKLLKVREFGKRSAEVRTLRLLSLASNQAIPTSDWDSARPPHYRGPCEEP